LGFESSLPVGVSGGGGGGGSVHLLLLEILEDLGGDVIARETRKSDS